MSIRTLLWAKDQTVITTSVRSSSDSEPRTGPSALDKLVLIAVGDEASEHSWDALLAVEDLAVFAGCTRRAARESLRRLEAAGYVRTRQTRVESGRSGWLRICLLSEDSPITRGLVEVDWSSPEHISQYQMRTFSDRHASGYRPSDSPALRPVDNPTSTGEPGRNEVPPRGRNEVPPGEERGSASEGERGSAPSCSADSSSPSEGTNERDDSVDEDPGGPPEWAATLVAELDFGHHVRPSAAQASEIAGLVAAARAEHGLSVSEIRTHCAGAISRARKSAAAYLRGALQPDRLPEPAARAASGSRSLGACEVCGSAADVPLRERQIECSDGRLRWCPCTGRTPAASAEQFATSSAVAG